MEQSEKTCVNCRWEFEDIDGSHCRHCIHSAEEKFEPKVKELSEQEIRNKAIEEFAERLKNKLVLRYGSATPTEQYVAMQVDEWCNEIAESMKGGKL